MINLLRRLFIKDYENVNNNIVRDNHGILASAVGIIINVILVIIKITIGLLTMNMGILTDSVNNVGDASSSVVSLVGFKMSSKPADKEHPYGHERIEYIAGLIISLIIISAGIIMGYTSIMDMINNDVTIYSNQLFIVTIVLLSISILFKVIQSYTNYKIGKIINSLTLKATMVDSRNDILATLFVIIGTTLIFIFQKNNIEVSFSISGVLGIVVAIYVIVSGINMMKDVLNPLIGTPVSEDLTNEILEYIKSRDIVIGAHDLLAHSYGETKIYMTIHIEVDGSNDIFYIHDQLDIIERYVYEKYNISLLIHMDPVDINNIELKNLKSLILSNLLKMDSNVKIHDFRFVNNDNNKILTFDVVTKYGTEFTLNDYIEKTKKILNANNINYEFYLNLDHE